VNRLPQKVKSFSFARNFQCFLSILRRPAAKNHNSRKAPDCPDIAFYGPHHARPGCYTHEP
jgi:hypothetical protein